MQIIHQLMQESDSLVVATLIYFAGVSDQTKLWFDRMFPYIGMNLSPKLPGPNKGSFIFMQNQPDARLFETPITPFMQMVELPDLSMKDYLVAYELDLGVKPPVTDNLEFMDRAYRMGRDLRN